MHVCDSHQQLDASVSAEHLSVIQTSLTSIVWSVLTFHSHQHMEGKWCKISHQSI